MALEMSGIASVMYLISRSPLKRMRSLLRLKAKKDVVIEAGVVITGLHGDRALSAIDTAPRHDPANTTRLAIDGLFLGLGLTPNTAVFAGTVGMNTFGEILVDENCRTNVPGLFAAGDATSVESKQFGVASGDGIKALLAAYAYLRK
ncbi:MAG: FAD-dependent oxidoreductase [Methanocorpusculum sp.]|nr:FAD-dependent oxidoreductase [Methanocorpusculum sp.]